jgi:hypothetical protein
MQRKAETKRIHVSALFLLCIRFVSALGHRRPSSGNKEETCFRPESFYLQLDRGLRWPSNRISRTSFLMSTKSLTCAEPKAISSQVVVEIIPVDAAMNRHSPLVRKLVFGPKEGPRKPFRWLIYQSHWSTVTHLQDKQRRYAKPAIVE